jgi:hypothetical protein
MDTGSTTEFTPINGYIVIMSNGNVFFSWVAIVVGSKHYFGGDDVVACYEVDGDARYHLPIY